MKQPSPPNDYVLHHAIQGIFPIPIYFVKRDSDLDLTEKKEIEDIIKEGMDRSYGNSSTNNAYIFNNGKLKKIKQFIEQQLKIYVEQVIRPKQKLDWYITGSWLNINKPGEHHHSHYHSNSILSGVFYISTEDDDRITFQDPNEKIKRVLAFEPTEYDVWNSSEWFFSVNTNDLILFPSWLDHKVDVNEKATTDRISISFNTFVRGTLGRRNNKTELILL